MGCKYLGFFLNEANIYFTCVCYENVIKVGDDQGYRVCVLYLVLYSMVHNPPATATKINMPFYLLKLPFAHYFKKEASFEGLMIAIVQFKTNLLRNCTSLKQYEISSSTIEINYTKTIISV
jgi:hypothetical protein